MTKSKIKIVNTSLAGCFGCHMSFLDMDERLVDLLKRIEFKRSPLPDIKYCGSYDIGLIKSGVCNAENVHVFREFRRNVSAPLADPVQWVLVCTGRGLLVCPTALARNLYVDYLVEASFHISC